MVKITISSILDKWISNEDGQKLYLILKNEMHVNDIIYLSFDKIDSVSSSFINSALISLLNDFDFEQIKSKLSIIDSNANINNLIKRRFIFETTKRKT
jgi:hypothetical protein